jgi:hypothetical protein
MKLPIAELGITSNMFFFGLKPPLAKDTGRQIYDAYVQSIRVRLTGLA